jgi:Protein of unknown function DUF262
VEFNSSEQNIIWFRDRYNASELVLKPSYQRNPVWSAKQKCALVESILLGFPIPELYIQHAVKLEDDKEMSEYGVVDGQQRIRTILQFMGIDKTPGEQEWNGFALDKVPTGSQFIGQTYHGLTPTARNQFLKYKFAVRNIDSDDQQIREIFKRINKYSTKLNEQELRNATYTGPFIRLANELAEDDYWITSRLVSPSQVRRMKDIEFVAELLIGVMHGPQAGSPAAVNEYFVQYEDYEDEFPNQKKVAERFRSTKKTIDELLSMGNFSRFHSNRTDYYSLFVAVAVVSIDKQLPKTQVGPLRTRLQKFETLVDKRLADESLAAPEDVVKYVRAAEKGVNDKARRSDRHGVLMAIVKDHFR